MLFMTSLTVINRITILLILYKSVESPNRFTLSFYILKYVHFVNEVRNFTHKVCTHIKSWVSERPLSLTQEMLNNVIIMDLGLQPWE